MVLPIVLKLTTRGLASGMTRPQLNQIKSAAYMFGVQEWHDKFMPIHFTNRASRLYDYQERSGEGSNLKGSFKRSYTGRKLRKRGHTRPLEFTGTAKGQARTRAKFKRTSAGAKVTMRVPALNFRPKGWTFTLREELTILIDPEIQEMKEVSMTQMMRMIRRLSKKNKKTKTHQ